MARAAHTFCATKGVGDVAACSTLTVAQELGLCTVHIRVA